MVRRPMATNHDYQRQKGPSFEGPDGVAFAT